ncbi:kinase-like protein [Mollisia scopiformis]|uniref:Kinase-like protein n=1 Tax=Mollisia scopiformis TaxID=149040 RepID=A0A132B622_MOLSC|nr:kinase-like protein [Mollisia scopiformis]KUJ07850.1 kinase-like protein [Mollisia scopiformis]
MADIPSIQIEDGTVFRTVPTDLTHSMNVKSQPPAPWTDESLPDIEPISRNEKNIVQAIETRLRDYAVHHPGDTTKKFWPRALFDHLLDRTTIELIVEALLDRSKLAIAKGTSVEDAKRHWINRIWGCRPEEKGSRRLLALLILVGKEDSVQSFLDLDFDDDSIPLNESKYDFGSWRKVELDGLESYQRGMKVPFLSTSTIVGKVFRVTLEENDIEPWYRTSDLLQRSSLSQNAGSISSTAMQLQAMTLGAGGYGEVYKIFMHPWQHNFQEVLRSLSAHQNHFALKRLYTTNKSTFERETDMLQRFSGHPNIVTLLAAITCKKILGREEYHLLFPWAEGDLLAYWKEEAKPRRTHENTKWISAQVCAIVEAVRFIHEPGPTMRTDDGKNLYGRHGDIKPENVLLFKPNGVKVLVISDLGLSAVHREESRSNVPGFDIPRTPNYRPPECDMAGRDGHISRSFDIWTLGCLFLEFVVWSLDGWGGRQEFRNDRCSPYINSYRTDIFFDIMVVSGETSKYAFKIKHQVEQHIKYLHGHPDCTQYLHDILNIIQTRMLIVESDEPRIKRIRAPELLQEMKALQERCRDRAYCLTKCPQESTHTPHLPVLAALNRMALELIDDNRMDICLEKYSGKTRSANLRARSP